MFHFYWGSPLLFGPPNAYFWGVRTPPTPRKSTRLNFKHNLKSKCQSKSVRKTKQLTYDQTKETNRMKDKKIEIIEKIADFFCQILQCDNGCDFFGCFDAIIRCDIFLKKTWDAMRFSMRCDCHLC